MQAALALEDGTILHGEAFGATGETTGEVVFNTGMTGYQEVLTDPSYCGQIVVMTYPLVGNYGVNPDDWEAERSFVRGFVVREHSTKPSNWRAAGRLEEFLAEQGVIGLAGIDTRALTRHLRQLGTMRGIISTKTLDVEELVHMARMAPPLSGQNFVAEVATSKIYTFPGEGATVVVVDFGAKRNIVRSLQRRGCRVVVVPPATTAGEILTLNPDGVVLSNGPGDPTDVPYVLPTVRQLIQKKPIFGICLGHQILALALGAKTYKLKFGHRGVNHPVQDLASGRVYISSHNHGFAVAEDSLAATDLLVSHRSLNDGTVEGLKHRFLPVFSVQYHPEASPGPDDSEYLFDEFLTAVYREVKH